MILKMQMIMMVNSGGLCEQFVGQHLLYLNEYYKKPELYYWVREAKSSSAEVDYVISSGTEIIPVEVKAGKTGRLKSLHQFVKEKGVDLSVRINLAKPSVFQQSTRVPGGQPAQAGRKQNILPQKRWVIRSSLPCLPRRECVSIKINLEFETRLDSELALRIY